MAAVFGQRFTARPRGPRPVSARLGLGVAVALSVLLHLAGGWPIRVTPGAVAAGETRPLQTRIIYTPPDEPRPTPAVDQASRTIPSTPEPAATEAPAPVIATPAPAEKRRGSAIVVPAKQPPATSSPSEPIAREPVSAKAQPAAPVLPPAPDYTKVALLDPPPRPLQDIDPAYPPSAGMRQGSVVLRLLISETGHVDNVAVVRATPPGVFDDAALAAFGAATFSPGRLLGVAVKSQWTVEVEFTPVNRGSAVGGREY